MWKPTTLRQRVAAWIGVSTALSLLVFAGVASGVALFQDESEDTSTVQPDSFAERLGEVESEVLLALAVAAPFGLAFAVGGAYWLVRRALAPLDAVVAAARHITPTQMSSRLPVPPVADEVQALVLALNASFARLEEGFVVLERFAGHASHELRTPLTTLRNEFEVALRRPRSPAEWEAIALGSLQDIKRLGDLTDGLLGYTRAHLSPADPRACTELGALLGEVVAQHRPRQGGPDIALVVNVSSDDDGLWVIGDRDGLSSAISNIVRNAVTFAGPNGRVEICARASEGSVVTTVIDDNGPGIAPEDTESVFQPFARPRFARDVGSAKEPPKGVGLGLSITRSIVEAAGGTIRASRAPLGGARVSIDLPSVAASSHR